MRKQKISNLRLTAASRSTVILLIGIFIGLGTGKGLIDKTVKVNLEQNQEEYTSKKIELIERELEIIQREKEQKSELQNYYK